MYHPVTHVIFDMDGLLLDSGPRYAAAKSNILARYGRVYTPELKRQVQGQTAKNSAEQLIALLDLPITVDQFVKELRAQYEEAFKEYVPLLPGAKRLVEHLKQNNVPICIATSSNQSFNLKRKHHEQFLQLFNHIVKGSDLKEGQQGKPEPDLFLLAVEGFGESGPKQMKNVLVFEDSVNGVEAGVKAGMQVVWVPASYTVRSGTAATLTLSSLEEFQPEVFGLPPFKS